MRPSVIPLVAEELAKITFSSKNFEKLKTAILESIGCDVVDLGDLVEEVRSMCRGNCNFEDVDDEEVVKSWRRVFDSVSPKEDQEKDIQSAKKECSDNLGPREWERFKELKLYSLKRDKVDRNTDDRNEV
jgi:hypothetical protein